MGRAERRPSSGAQAGLGPPRTGRSFRRNDESLGLLPGGLVAFAGNGIADNPNDKAMTLGIPVQRVAA